METIDGVTMETGLSDEDKFCKVWMHYGNTGWSSWQADMWERFSDEQRSRIGKRLRWDEKANLDNILFLD